MIEQFGHPDLMLTLTFNNKWDEVKSLINNDYMKYTNEIKMDFKIYSILLD